MHCISLSVQCLCFALQLRNTTEIVSVYLQHIQYHYPDFVQPKTYLYLNYSIVVVTIFKVDIVNNSHLKKFWLQTVTVGKGKMCPYDTSTLTAFGYSTVSLISLVIAK